MEIVLPDLPVRLPGRRPQTWSEPRRLVDEGFQITPREPAFQTTRSVLVLEEAFRISEETFGRVFRRGRETRAERTRAEQVTTMPTLGFRRVLLKRTLKFPSFATLFLPTACFVDRVQMPPRSFQLLLLATLHALSLSALAQDVSFRNDVMPVLSKAGCNLGTCHGNARGKGGFQLSLRGQDPARDYLVLTREWLGRRTNSGRPDESLLLLKPTMQVAHEGGRRFVADSREYRVLRDWIAAGAPDDRPGTRKLTQLHVTPLEAFLAPSGETTSPTWQTQLTATAEYSDGTKSDATAHVVYESSNPIAEISPAGLVKGTIAGETTVLVRYQQLQVPVRLAFVHARPGFVWAAPAPANVIDQHVYAKLKRLKVSPSAACDDVTFVRRVHLDLLGSLPTADEARRFVTDTSPQKRATLIDELLELPEFADWWALKWADLLRIEEKTLDRKGGRELSWLVAGCLCQQQAAGCHGSRDRQCAGKYL